MHRSWLPAAAFCVALTAQPAAAQPATETSAAPPPPVVVSTLAAPDFFSAAGRDTGLPAELWRGTSPAIMKAVLPLLAAKPLSPASRALARRVLATGAPAPEAVGRDPAAAGQRVSALIALGGVAEANAILSKTSGLDRDPVLAQAAAEAALLSGDADRACALGAGLAEGRDGPYWLRLRAYCQYRRGDAGPAQLTYDLAQEQAHDAVFGRLMGARLAGAGDPGKASLRNGLDYALSRDLGLDLSQATPSPAVAAALKPESAVEATWPALAGTGGVRAALGALAAGDLAKARTMRGNLALSEVQSGGGFDAALLDAALAVASGQGLDAALDPLLALGEGSDPKLRVRAQTAASLLVALGAPLTEAARGRYAAFAAADGKAAVARAQLLDLAAVEGRTGEAALLALWISAEAGVTGPVQGDRARIVRALKAAGLAAEARAFALEGLLALR